MINERNMEVYVESKIPLEEHKYQGWFYYYPTKKFYRYNDIPYHIMEKDFTQEQLKRTDLNWDGQNGDS